MSPAPSPFSQGPRDVAPMPVLVLEDERFDRHRLARLCSALDFPCVITNATTLEHFSAALEDDAFGLIFLDYKLPDGNGLDALDMIRLCTRNLNAPTLMVSSIIDRDIVDKAARAGCAGYLSKDALTSATFDAAVKNALRSCTDPIALAKEKFDFAEMTDLLAQSTRHNARDIKPMVSRMMRQLRGLRASAESQNADALHTIEQNCESLWEFLVEMEQQDGTEILENMLADQSDAQGLLTGSGKPRKPPSPFSRLSH